MDNGASSYRRFREEDDESGLAEIIRDYKDGLILYIYSNFHPPSINLSTNGPTVKVCSGPSFSSLRIESFIYVSSVYRRKQQFPPKEMLSVRFQFFCFL